VGTYGEMSLSQAMETLKQEKKKCVICKEKGQGSDHTDKMIIAIDTIESFVDDVVTKLCCN